MGDRGPRQVRVRAWCRADLAGGTLDIWPLGLLHSPSLTVNVALDLAVELTMRRWESGFRIAQSGVSVEAASNSELAAVPESALIGLISRYFDLPPVDILVASGSPRGGGLGASSALTVAMIAAAEELLGRQPSSIERRCALARDFEAQLMSLPTGRQDHFPALLGGALRIEHRPGGEVVSRLDIDLERLGRSLVIVFSGESHFSAAKNWEIIRRRLDGDAETTKRFEEISRIARELGIALERGDLPTVGTLMGEEWKLRSGLAEGVSTSRIEDLLGAAVRAGAWGGKACGAGGGGCLAILTPERERAAVERALADLGAELLATAPVAEPIRITRE